MMTPPLDDHTLNACLARVIGLKWGFNTGTHQLGYFEGDTLRYAQNEWDPLHDANQLEEVEAWLKQNGIEFIISSAHLCNLMIVELILADGIFQGKDPDKKRAFALAIWQMEQGEAMKSKKLPCAEFLHECFEYNFMTGVLTWRERPAHHFKSQRAYNSWNARFPGRRAGAMTAHGYIEARINRVTTKIHRIVMAMMGVFDESKEVDHRNQNRTDNRLTNIREASTSQNDMNRGKYKNNKAKYKGVHFHKATGKYQSDIQRDGKLYYLGIFTKQEDAHEAYRQAASCLHGDFANFGGK